MVRVLRGNIQEVDLRVIDCGRVIPGGLSEGVFLVLRYYTYSFMIRQQMLFLRFRPPL